MADFVAVDTPATMFVYGTLRPGEERWPLLAPFVVDEGWDDAVPGRLYDTGLGYPGATFGPEAEPGSGGAGLVIGHTVHLLQASLTRALEVIDREEDLVEGLYRRVLVTTRAGIRAWAYEWAASLDLAPIGSGDWCLR